MTPDVYVPKIVLITGATGDFGTAFAERFAALGAKLVLHGRNPNKLDALTFDVPTHKICFDIEDKNAMEAAIDSLPAEFQAIDLLINNAGGALGLDKAHEAEIEDWETMIEVNNKALVRMTRLVLPDMVERKRGHIINIGSTAGNYPYPGGNTYCAVKAFTKQFSLALRSDLPGTNVRVTNIEPGQVETQFSKVRFKGDKSKADGVYAGTNNIHAEDIAEAVTWVATLPEKMNINRMEIMPTTQYCAGLAVERFD